MAANQEQRKGQALMNCLSLAKKHILVSQLIDSGLDPFYDDIKLSGALAFIEEHWSAPR